MVKCCFVFCLFFSRGCWEICLRRRFNARPTGLRYFWFTAFFVVMAILSQELA